MSPIEVSPKHENEDPGGDGGGGGGDSGDGGGDSGDGGDGGRYVAPSGHGSPCTSPVKPFGMKYVTPSSV
jgi:hypothetical protein